jgi:glycosyltransferase involved in cell wall biosynthesis
MELEEKSCSALPEEVAREIETLKRLSLVIGIPSLNNASSIGRVVEESIKGLKNHFPGEKALIINADGASTDGTPDIVKSIKSVDNITIMTAPYQGISGKGSAFKAFFEAALIGKARILLTIDSDNLSITEKWIKQLGYPLWTRGYGYVTPYYQRDKHDATISNNIAYPLTRSLYGQRIRQPIGGDFGLSRGLIQLLNRPDPWVDYTNICKFGVDIWVTTTAINEGFRICQASLQTKIHGEKDPGRDLSPMFRQVVGTLFGLMKKYRVCWWYRKHSRPVTLYGSKHYVEVEDVSVDEETLLASFRDNAAEYESYWEKILDPKDIDVINALRETEHNETLIPPDAWARIVYCYAFAYNNREDLDRKIVLESLIPLYHARTASFMLETHYLNDELADAHVEACSEVFERLKSHLLSKWKKRKAEEL